MASDGAVAALLAALAVETVACFTMLAKLVHAQRELRVLKRAAGAVGVPPADAPGGQQLAPGRQVKPPPVPLATNAETGSPVDRTVLEDSSAGSLSVQHRVGDSEAKRESTNFERRFSDQSSPGEKQRDVAAHLAAFYSRFAPEKLKDVKAIVSDFGRRGANDTEWHRLNDDLRATYGQDLDSVTVHKAGSPDLLLSPSLPRPYNPELPGGRATTALMPIPMEPGLSVSHSNSLHSSQPGGAFGRAVAPHKLNFSSIAQRISSLHDSPDGNSTEVRVNKHPQAPSNAYPGAHQSLSSIIREFKEGPMSKAVLPRASKAIGRAVWASSLQADPAQGTSSPSPDLISSRNGGRHAHYYVHESAMVGRQPPCPPSLEFLESQNVPTGVNGPNTTATRDGSEVFNTSNMLGVP